jgi:type II secretory pathway component HofQ
MFMTKVKMAVVVLLALGVLGSGAGMYSRDGEAGAAAPAPTRPAPDKAPPAEAKDATAQTPAEQASAAAHEALHQVIDFHGLDDPKTTVQEALDALGKLYNVQFDVNEKAFAADNLENVQTYEFAAQRTIPPMKAPLKMVLGKILSRLPNESGAVLMIRKGFVELTTQKAVKAELGIPETRQLLPLVYKDIEDKPLPAALRALANASGFSIVLDRQAAGDRAAKVTAELHNVPVDTAVKVLADLADLGVVRLDNVLYVTSREKAARLQAEQPPPAPARPVVPPTPPKPAAAPEAKENAKKAP